MKHSNKSKRTGILITAFLLILAMCTPVIASADGTIPVSNGFKHTIILSKIDQQRGYSFYAEDLPANVKNVKVTSSKKSVATVKGNGPLNFTVTPKKVGTTKITLKGKSGKKAVKCAGTIKVVKFQQPFKTFKINGVSQRGAVTSSINVKAVEVDKSKAKIDFKAASGWKVLSATVYSSTGKSQKLKNGKTYTIAKQGYLAVSLYMENKKNGAVIENYFNIRQAQQQ